MKRLDSFRLAALLGVLASLVLLSACDRTQRPPTEPSLGLVQSLGQGVGRAIERFPEMLDSLPATRIRDESEPLRPELSDAELVDRVSRAGGRVFIGFKPAGASHTRETGVVPAIHRATALAGREAVVALGPS